VGAVVSAADVAAALVEAVARLVTFSAAKERMK